MAEQPLPRALAEARPKTMRENIEWAKRVCKWSFRNNEPATMWIMFSGGNDSATVLHLLTQTLKVPIEGVVHINTGTGIPATTEHVRRLIADWGLRLEELHPPETFEEVFLEQAIIDGLPGPGMHAKAYQRLKERAVENFVSRTKRSWWDRVILFTGIRHDESLQRMGYTDTIVDRKGAQVWVNPVYWMSDLHIRRYRERFDIPVNPVSVHLHYSGECLCGSYARPGELEEIAFFYPEVAVRIRGWEERAIELGLKYHHWGEARKGKKEDDEVGPMCRACVARRS